jgi:hypothetical protein
VRQGHVASSPPSYAWLLDVLLGRTPALTWAAGGGLPAGFRLTEQFAVLPTATGRSFLVSLNARRSASSALTSYNALRSPLGRVVRRALGTGLRTGLAQPLLRSKIDVGTAAGTPPEQLAGLLPSAHLAEVFGRGPVDVVISGGDGPYRKPVLQVFGADGAPLGFVKVGWNDWTRDAVRQEAAALRCCADGRPACFSAPALLDHHQWRGLDFLVTAPMPLGVRRLGVGSPLPGAGVLREISALAGPYAGELAGSPWWADLRTRIAASDADPTARAEFDEAAGRVESSAGHALLQFGMWHGDFVPWNLAWLGRRVIAWDWESSTPHAPVGFDALHFHFQTAFVARRLPLDQALRAARASGPALAALGVPADQHRLLATLYLLELFVRHEEARSSAGQPDDRFYPAVVPVLHQSLRASPPGAGRLHASGRSS